MVDDSKRPLSEQLSQFRKNRFFDGKLMTARDMECEQRYHADRLETLTRQTIGSGVLSGLEVRSIKTIEGRLEVTVDAGIAVDPVGRLIVVETSTTKSFSEPDGEACHLFVRFDAVETDPVAVPDADSRHPDAEAGRVVESFELTYRDSLPERSAPAVDITDHIDSESTVREVADRAAAAYDQHHSAQLSDPAVYLGGFERTADGSWKPIDAVGPTYVYDNELLCTLLFEHLTDTDNPHQTDVEASSQPDPTSPELDTINERLEQLHAELSTVKNRQETTTQHLLGKTLASASRLFAGAADRFTDHHPAVSKAARDISQQIGTASHSAATDDDEQFCSLVRRLQPSLVEFGDRLDGAAHQETVDRYTDALAHLQSTLEASEPAVETAIAFDEVAEAAVDLDVVYPAHAER